MTTRQYWDYHVEEDASPDRLSEMGALGWELVTVLPVQASRGSMFYFKRPAADLRERVTLDHRQRFVAGAEAAQGSGE